MHELGIVVDARGARERASGQIERMLREHQGGANARNESERETLEWRASDNLRSCDRYKRNIFLFPGLIII